MDIPAPTNLWMVLAVILAIVVVLQLAFEGLILALGSVVVWALSAGRIKVGERRSLGKPPPKLTGGNFFYFEESRCYVYQNYVVLIGLVTVLLVLTAIFGASFWANAH
jgi:hypothetical protein